MYDQSIPFTAYAFIGVTTLVVTYSHLLMSSENEEENSLQEIEGSTPEENENENENENTPIETVQNTLSDPTVAPPVNTMPNTTIPAATVPSSTIPSSQSTIGGKKKRKTRNKRKKAKKSNRVRKTKSTTKRKYLLF